jgi:hypothetical protein
MRPTITPILFSWLHTVLHPMCSCEEIGKRWMKAGLECELKMTSLRMSSKNLRGLKGVMSQRSEDGWWSDEGGHHPKRQECARGSKQVQKWDGRHTDRMGGMGLYSHAWPLSGKTHYIHVETYLCVQLQSHGQQNAYPWSCGVDHVGWGRYFKVSSLVHTCTL